MKMLAPIAQKHYSRAPADFDIIQQANDKLSQFHRSDFPPVEPGTLSDWHDESCYKKALLAMVRIETDRTGRVEGGVYSNICEAVIEAEGVDDLVRVAKEWDAAIALRHTSLPTDEVVACREYFKKKEAKKKEARVLRSLNELTMEKS